MKTRQILVVSAAVEDYSVPVAESVYRLSYSFIDDTPSDGFSAWRVSSSADAELVEIRKSCEPLQGGYAQHALNRFFSQALLRCRPALVVVVGLNGCTVDLPRVSALLNVPVMLVLGSPAQRPEQLPEDTCTWLQASLASCQSIIPLNDQTLQEWPSDWIQHSQIKAVGTPVEDVLSSLQRSHETDQAYDYSLYEFCQRDHPLLVGMQIPDTGHFQGCGQVLDLACGVGIFLDCLRREGINAQGVERDERIARYARGMGLDVKTGDALEFLERSSGNYDGVYCSHFVEHLPVESVQELLEQFARTLAPGGVLVLVFPDPESIRSQLLGFWRDPEHVRFYHPELISAMAVAAGLELEWSSYDEQPHRVVPFSEDPPQIPQYSVFPSLESGAAQQRSGGLLDKIFRKLGLAQESQLRQLEARLGSWSEALQQESERQLAASRVLEERTSQLWDINRTWAWNDNVTLKLRKQAR